MAGVLIASGLLLLFGLFVWHASVAPDATDIRWVKDHPGLHALSIGLLGAAYFLASLLD